MAYSMNWFVFMRKEGLVDKILLFRRYINKFFIANEDVQEVSPAQKTHSGIFH